MAGHTPIELEFSRKYDRQHAQQYFQKHIYDLKRNTYVQRQ